MSPFVARIAALSNKQALIFGAMLSFFYYFSLFDDGSKLDLEITRIKQQTLAEQQKEQESDRAIARIQQLKESYTALEDQFRIISAKIPVDLQMSEILRTVETMARTSGITIKSTEPRAVIRENLIETLPLRVTGSGRFSEAALFIYNLSSIERIFRVKSIVITGPPDSQPGERLLAFEAELASYRFVGSETAADGEKKGAGP